MLCAFCDCMIVAVELSVLIELLLYTFPQWFFYLLILVFDFGVGVALGDFPFLVSAFTRFIVHYVFTSVYFSQSVS